MPIPRQYRQGDVLIMAASIPPSATRQYNKEVVLAEGEITGHLHRNKDPGERCEEWIDTDGTMYLRVHSEQKSGSNKIEHEEHDTAVLEPGEYKIVRQIEVWMDEIRQVAD